MQTEQVMLPTDTLGTNAQCTCTCSKLIRYPCLRWYAQLRYTLSSQVDVYNKIDYTPPACMITYVNLLGVHAETRCGTQTHHTHTRAL